MEKDVLFSIPMFRGSQKDQNFIYTNFYQALQGMVKEKLFFVEYFADMIFTIDGNKQVLRNKIKRIYLADIRPYKELWYRAVNDKWLKVPYDFMYDKKYSNRSFLFSKRAREIGEIYNGEFIALKERYLELINQDAIDADCKINLTIQKDSEFVAGDGCFFHAERKALDFNSALSKLRKDPADFICIAASSINYKTNAKIVKTKTFYICAEEDRISPEEALKKSNNLFKIRRAIEQGEQNFIYHAKQNFVTFVHNGIFVPRDTLLNLWQI